MAGENRPIYRAGIVGLGYIGGADQISGDAIGGQQVAHLDGSHAEAYSKSPRVELLAGSSRDAGRRERFTQRTGARTYADWRQMLASEPLDIVSVATYGPSHAEIAIACARSGVRAIYGEKPIATRLPDAEAIVAACEQAGALLVINHTRSFNPNYRRLRDLIATGGLGDLSSIAMRWGAGRLGNVGTHLINATCLLTGREVRAVSGTLDLSGRPDCRGPQFRDPGAWGLLRFDGGLIATLDAADYGAGRPHLTLYGTQGRAVTGGEEVLLEYWDGRQELWPSLRAEATSMDRAVAEIVAWLDGERPFSCPGDSALRTLEAIVGFHASHARNATWTELPLTGTDREYEILSG